MDQHYNYGSEQIVSYGSVGRLIKLYWSNKQYIPVMLALSVMIMLATGLILLDFVFNYWYYSYFYGCLQSYDKSGFIHLLSFFTVLIFCYGILGIHRYIAAQLTERQWLNRKTIIYLFLKYQRLLFQGKKIKNYTVSSYQPTIELMNASLDFTMRLVIFVTAFSGFMYYLCLLTDELTSQFHLLDMTNYCLGAGCLFAIYSSFYLIKNKIYFTPAIHHCLIILERNLPLWLLTGHSVIYVVFSLLLILPDYVEKIYLILAVIYSLQLFLRGQRVFLFGRE